MQASIRAGVLAVAATLLSVCALGGATAAEPQEADATVRPSILLVLIDTLRADHLGYHGYDRQTSPAIDAFARDNLVFNRAIAPAPWTPPSVASMFTGVYPTVHGVHTHVYEEEKASDQPVLGEVLADGFVTLAEALRGRGYRTEAVVTNPWVTEYLGFAQGFDTYKQVDYQSATNVNRTVSRLLQKRRADSTPFFLYVHYFEPHVPYEPPASFADRFSGTVEGSTRLPPEKADWINLYDAEIATVDHGFGRLIDELKRSGLYEDLVVLLVGDHGEQFYERGDHGHGYRLHAEETHVPFILRAGGKRGAEKTMVSLVDVYPTLLSLAGAEVPSNQGVSLVDDLERRHYRGVFSEMTRWRNQKSYSVGGKKLILEFDAPDTATVSRDRETAAHLFDIEGDAAEVAPLDDRELLAEMRESLYAIYRDSLFRREGVESSSKPLSPETIEKLRSLGYIE